MVIKLFYLHNIFDTRNKLGDLGGQWNTFLAVSNKIRVKYTFVKVVTGQKPYISYFYMTYMTLFLHKVYPLF